MYRCSANLCQSQRMNLLKPPCDEGVIAAKNSAAPCGKKLGPWILAATILGSSMVFIDGTVVNVALPALQTNLKAPTYLLTQVVLTSSVCFLRVFCDTIRRQ
jgi:hypothetical protein